jgi:hypothetical protein
MADRKIIVGQKLKTAHQDFLAVIHCWRKHAIDETPTIMRNFVPIDLYFIAQMPLILFMVMCRYRWRYGRILHSLVFAHKGASWLFHQFPCRVMQPYYWLCGSLHRWKESGRKQYSDVLMALACGWWITISDSFINPQHDYYVNYECYNCWST